MSAPADASQVMEALQSAAGRCLPSPKTRTLPAYIAALGMGRVFSDEQNPSIHFHFASPALWVLQAATCQLVRVKARLQPGRDASLSHGSHGERNSLSHRHANPNETFCNVVAPRQQEQQTGNTRSDFLRPRWTYFATRRCLRY